MEKLIIGLPNGRHIRKAIYVLLKQAGFDVLEYAPNFVSRKYQTSVFLPSKSMCTIFIDQPRDLIFGLLSGTCDVIITGQDYVEDYEQFVSQNSSTPFLGKGDMICSAHIGLQNLGFPGGKFAFMTQKNTSGNTLEQFIALRKKIVCYSEFPMLAMNFLMGTDSYKKKYGSKRPFILSTFSQNGANENAVIIYSHGSTESKAVQNSNALIFDLIITGKTQTENNLRVIEFVGDPICNLLYKRKNLSAAKNKILKEFVTIVEYAVVKQSNIYTVRKQKIK